MYYLVKCHIECILYLNMVLDLFMRATSRTSWQPRIISSLTAFKTADICSSGHQMPHWIFGRCICLICLVITHRHTRSHPRSHRQTNTHSWHSF